MSKEIVIPNWTIFGAYAVGITVFKHEKDPEDDESTVWYQPAIDVFLDDGEGDEESLLNEKTAKHITICSDISADSILEAIKQLISPLSQCFDGLTSTAVVIGDDGEVIQTVDLESIRDELFEEEFLGSSENPSGVLH